MKAKLQALSALSVSFLAIHTDSASAQIFVDFDPDILVSYDTAYTTSSAFIERGAFRLDMNADGIDDFSFTVKNVNPFSGSYGTSSSEAQVEPLGGNALVGASTVLWGGFVAATASALENCTSIGPSGPFAYNQAQLVRFTTSHDGGFSTTNDWYEDGEFLGVKVISGGQEYYGWVRLNFSWVGPGLSYQIDSYFLSGTAGVPISTNPPDAVDSLQVDDSGPGVLEESIRVQFSVSGGCPTEEFVDEYRVYVVKDVELDEAVFSEPFYHSVAPMGSGGAYDFTLPDGTLASDGDSIQYGQPYFIHVLTVPLGGITPTSGMVSIQPITLFDGGALFAPNNLILEDLGNSFNASDFRLRFDVPTTEFGIDKYDIFLVPASTLATFDLAFAESCPYRMPVLPTGGNFDLYLNSSLRDVNGNWLVLGTTYYAFVLSVDTDPTDYVGGLSAPSNPALFTNAPYPGLPSDDGDDDDMW